jgi:hypothetical protein
LHGSRRRITREAAEAYQDELQAKADALNKGKATAT